MATKFLESISNGNRTLSQRASALEMQARIAQQSIVDSIKKEIANTQINIANLTDLSPESKDSLRPGTKDWNAEEWADELQKAKVSLWRLNVSLSCAEETMTEFFTETTQE